MRMNYDYCKLDENSMLRYAPMMVEWHDMLCINPPREVYAALDWFFKEPERPTSEEGKVLVANEPKDWEWDKDAMTVTVTYHAEDIPEPEPIPRRWTPLTLKRGAVARGWWNALKGILEGANGYEDFIMCQFVAEDDAMFSPIYGALCDAFGEDAVREYLAELPTEA